MRIGTPAHKHGVPDVDILHALRTALRLVTMDDDLTMIIVSATNGALLEVGILDLEGTDPVVVHCMALRRKFLRHLR